MFLNLALIQSVILWVYVLVFSKVSQIASFSIMISLPFSLIDFFFFIFFSLTDLPFCLGLLFNRPDHDMTNVYYMQVRQLNRPVHHSLLQDE